MLLDEEEDEEDEVRHVCIHVTSGMEKA